MVDFVNILSLFTYSKHIPKVVMIVHCLYINACTFNVLQIQEDNLATNGEVTGDMSLRDLWSWLDAARSLVTAGNFKLPGGVPYRYQGVL